ncbi:hypothetical protein V1477_012742 [Vespula maculifrons]|uniref:Uncharacterized protein n=1 Tax=Vespula maculifrons TaxID=7453 RepID=A0ABD2BVD4_VESMC
MITRTCIIFATMCCHQTWIYTNKDYIKIFLKIIRKNETPQGLYCLNITTLFLECIVLCLNN